MRIISKRYSSSQLSDRAHPALLNLSPLPASQVTAFRAEESGVKLPAEVRPLPLFPVVCRHSFLVPATTAFSAKGGGAA
jgi:hypothetical protein